MTSKPKNWPDLLPYLTSPLHGKDLTTAHLVALRTIAPPPEPRILAQDSPTPSPLVRIQRIPSGSTHPASGQHGLFATRDLKPGTFILVYLGRTHPGAAAAEESDYDIWLDRDADLAVDAAKEGNEARFVNDYRGVRERANAEFRRVWCERWGEACVGVWVLPDGKKRKGEGIRRGEEIVVSYGKGFWEARREAEE